MALCLHPKRNSALDLVAVVATTFPRWQVLVTVPPQAVKHFSKDMEIARTAEECTTGEELTLEIGLLVKGVVLDATNIQRQTVQDLAERRRQVAALVKQHRENEKDRKKKEKQEAKGAGNTEVAHLAPTRAPK